MGEVENKVSCPISGPQREEPEPGDMSHSSALSLRTSAPIGMGRSRGRSVETYITGGMEGGTTGRKVGDSEEDSDRGERASAEALKNVNFFEPVFINARLL